jgi:hypothetical protein
VSVAAKARGGAFAARAADIEYATMALLFQPGSRADSVLMFAVLGSRSRGLRRFQGPVARLRRPGGPGASLVPDPDDGGHHDARWLPRGGGSGRPEESGTSTGAIRFLAVAGQRRRLREDGQRAGSSPSATRTATAAPDVKETFGEGGGSGIALRDGYLYSSTTSAIYRYKMTPGELVPKGAPELVVSGLPDERQHNSKSFAFGPDGQLYVEVGSPSNSYGGAKDRALGAKGEDPTEFLKTHGGWWRFDPTSSIRPRPTVSTTRPGTATCCPSPGTPCPRTSSSCRWGATT